MKLKPFRCWRHKLCKNAYLRKRRRQRCCCISSSLGEVFEILNPNTNFRNRQEGESYAASDSKKFY